MRHPLFGLRAHDQGRGDPALTASRAAALGASHIQLAPGKVFDEPWNRIDAWSADDARMIRSVLDEAGISVSVLGCYVNLAHPDPDVREKNLQLFRASLAMALLVGAGVTGTETGSVRADYGADPANSSDEAFSILRSSLERLARDAGAFGSRFAIEAVHHHILSTPLRMERMIRELGSQDLRVILDPVNLVGTPGDDPVALTRESLQRYGEVITTLHVKDYVIADGKVAPSVPGRGLTDWAAIARVLEPLRGKLAVIIEACPPDAVPGVVAYLGDCGLLV